MGGVKPLVSFPEAFPPQQIKEKAVYGRATLTQVRDYFGMNGADMRKE
jgi:hypothetical protein